MANSRTRQQQERRERARSTKPVELSLYLHDKSKCACRIEQLPVELEGDKEILLVLHYDDRGKLVWFAILLNSVTDGRGAELYSVDTSHGHYHEHRTGHKRRNDRKDIRPLYSQVNVQESYDHGYDLVMARYSAMTGR